MSKTLKQGATIAITFVVVVVVAGMVIGRKPANRAQGHVSPSGKYVLSVSTKLRISRLEPVWAVTIRSPAGSVLYQDADSTFFAGLNVYHGWDAQDRVWLYNSDDGGIWRWELVDGSWKKLRSSREDGIPDGILPPYATSRR